MAQIPRSLLDSLSSEIGLLSDAAKTQVGFAFEKVFAAWDGSDIATLRNAIIQVFQTVMPTYTDLSAALAAEFYDTIRQYQGITSSYQSSVWSGYNETADEQAIRALLQSVVESKDTDKFRNNLLDRVDAEVRKSANRCVSYNASRDPAHPSWALVPSGLETCGFCLMIASFGFQYSQEVHGHENCDCRAVVSFDSSTTIEGYDPDGMYERYQDCLDTLGGRDGIWEDWQALSEEKRAAYIQRHGGDSSEAYEAYVQSRIVAEIKSRDSGWFKGLSECQTSIEEGAEPKKKEETLAFALNKHGFNVMFRKPVNTAGNRTADSFLNGVSWEFKQPIGNPDAQTIGKNTIDHQFEEAIGQSRNLVLDFRVIEQYPSVNVDDACETAVNLLNGKWRDDFDQIMVVGGGWLRTYKKA